MDSNKIKLLNNGINKLKTTVEETTRLINRLEEERKLAIREELNKEIKRNPEGVINAVNSSLSDIFKLMEREMLLSPFYSKIVLSKEEDENRIKKQSKKPNMVNHPKHYQGKMECIDAMEQEFGSVGVEWFCLLNAFKYEYRKGKKVGECNGAVQDMKKRNWYIDKFNELRKAKKRDGITSKDLEELVNKYR